MYSFESRIRYSETDSEGKLTLAALLNYFQDCSTFQSEDLGLGIDYLKSKNLVWVLSSWQIVVEEYPLLGTQVEVATSPYEFKSFLGYRNFAMKDKEGHFLAKANSLWSLLSIDTKKPALPLPEITAGYPLEPKLPMDYASRKIALPGEACKKDPIVVKKHHLDTNHHVNNGQYVLMAMEYLPEGFFVRQLRAEYRKQAFLDDVFHPMVRVASESIVVAFLDEEGKAYFVAEFS